MTQTQGRESENYRVRRPGSALHSSSRSRPHRTGGGFRGFGRRLDLAAGILGGPWRFLAPADLRGRGASSGITGGEDGIPEHARDLLVLMGREGLEQMVLIGHSMGAMSGVYLATHHPEWLRGLVL